MSKPLSAAVGEYAAQRADRLRDSVAQAIQSALKQPQAEVRLLVDTAIELNMAARIVMGYLSPPGLVLTNETLEHARFDRYCIELINGSCIRLLIKPDQYDEKCRARKDLCNSKKRHGRLRNSAN